MAWQIAMQVAKRYFPQVLLPITITVGFIGYSIENYIRSPQPGEKSKSVSEIREERRLSQMDSTGNEITSPQPVERSKSISEMREERRLNQMDSDQKLR